MSEQVKEIAIAELHGFRDHPFQVKDDESFQELCDSIQKYGVLSPLLCVLRRTAMRSSPGTAEKPLRFLWDWTSSRYWCEI